jgi:hypothetical protein
VAPLSTARAPGAADSTNGAAAVPEKASSMTIGAASS